MRGILAFLNTPKGQRQIRQSKFSTICYYNTRQCCHTSKLPLPYMTRCMSSFLRNSTAPRTSRDSINSISEAEEAVRQAILDKVLRAGRQTPAELMLRCTFLCSGSKMRSNSCGIILSGTILDAEGTCPVFILLWGRKEENYRRIPYPFLSPCFVFLCLPPVFIAVDEFFSFEGCFYRCCQNYIWRVQKVRLVRWTPIKRM